MTWKDIENSIAESETVAFDIADLDFSGFFSQSENETILNKLNTIKSGVKNHGFI